VKSWDLGAFDGESAQGTWTLSVDDNAAADTGTLNNWGLVISGLGDAAPANPVAGFEFAVEGLSVGFTNTSTDANDDIVSYSWDFGDGTSSAEMSPSHVYAAAGTYTVTLTATDALEHSNTVSMEVQVYQHSINASVTRALVSRRGSAMVDVQWDSALGEAVAIYRDGQLVVTTENDGNYRDRFSTAATSVTYQVCETSGSLCSAPVVAQF
jgi:PKD repeat protein